MSRSRQNTIQFATNKLQTMNSTLVIKLGKSKNIYTPLINFMLFLFIFAFKATNLVFMQSFMCQLYKLNKGQVVIYLWRDSRGFGAKLGHVGVKRLKNKLYEASAPKETKCEGCPITKE